MRVVVDSRQNQSLALVGMDNYSPSERRPSAVNLRNSGNRVFPRNDTTQSIFSITKGMLFEFPAISHLRRPRSRRPQRRRRFLTHRSDDGGPLPDESLNSHTDRAAGRKGQNRNLRRGKVVKHEDGCQKREKKRKRKHREAKGNTDELEGLDVIRVKREEVDLKFLARVGDGAYEGELKRLTMGLASDGELLGFLKGLEGRWCSRRKRRKVVDAAGIVKALPKNWKLELSLRSRRRRPFISCRRYVSPCGERFKSCKDVAFYLKAQFSTNVANPPVEGGSMRQIQSVCHMGPQSQVEKVARKHLPDAEVNLSDLDDLHDVEISHIFECHRCKLVFDGMKELENHHGRVHGRNTRRLDFNALAMEGAMPLSVIDISVPPGVPKRYRTMDDLYRNTELILLPKANAARKGSSHRQNTTVPARVLKGSNETFKTNCIWCTNEFSREPVGAETLAEAVGFICPSCKNNLSGPLDNYLARCSQE